MEEFSSVLKYRSKKDKLVKNVQYYEAVLKKWEDAVFKTEGKKPGKNEMKSAPDKIQRAYKEYYKARKLLKGLSSTSCLSPTAGNRAKSRSGSKGPSPRKIFVKDSVQSAGRNRHDHNEGSPTALKTGILKHKQRTNTKVDKTKPLGVNYSVFQEKILFAVNVFVKKSPAKKHNVVSVFDSEAGETVSRNILIPNRFTKNSSSLAVTDGRETSHFHPFSPVRQNSSQHYHHNSLEIKSTDAKQVDSAWLDRCGFDSSESQNHANSVDTAWLDGCGSEPIDSQNHANPVDTARLDGCGSEPSESQNHANPVDTAWLDRCNSDSSVKQNNHTALDVPDSCAPARMEFDDSCNNKESLPEPESSMYCKSGGDGYNEGPCNSGPSYKKRKLMGGESLAIRVKKRTVNENFVKIDITKKVFVRGHKKISGAKVKRNQWKTKKSASSKEQKLKNLVCQKCGENGHIGKFCLKGSIPSDEPKEKDESPFPSLQEAALMANSKLSRQTTRVNIFAPKDVIDSSDQSLNIPQPINRQPIKFAVDDEDTVLNEAIAKFGYKSFRPGQKEAVSRILRGLSTLLVLSTGSGKSLCYQLPAYLYALKNPGAIAICVSPLVSLMEDQVEGIPGFLHAAFLHSNMPSNQRDKVIEKVRSKKLHILLVSPEAVCGGLFRIFGDELPPISFACIDEVHCVSQWSHNFRPSYLQLAKILREKLNVQTILGLTATATEYTVSSICTTLQIDPSSTIRGETIPKNLNLSVSRDMYRDEALLSLLRGERFRECESIIIYCTRRDECTRIAALIRTSLQDMPGHNGVSKLNLRQRISNNCEAYHAGMTAGKRRLVQQYFMSGKIRIVVATVAFGMGIDKADIRSVIHYNMPKTFESYVQEIGRAGRDGLPAHCHLFLDSVKGKDLSELKRHVYCNSIDRTTLRKFFRRVFQPCKCLKLAQFTSNSSTTPLLDPTQPNRRCPGHEISFCIDETVQELDLPQENITTILCYLELDSHKKWIEMLPHTYQTCKIHSYGGAALLKSASMKCPPLAAAIALKQEKKQFKENDVYLEFNVIEVSSTLGWNSGAVKKELKNLEWTGTNFDNNGNAAKFRKSGILVEFSDLAFHAIAPGDLSDEECDVVLDYLYNHNQEQEKTQLYQLHRVYQALHSVSHNSVQNLCDKVDDEKSQGLKHFIHTYFLQKTLGVPPEWKTQVSYPESQEEEIRRDVRDLLASVKDVQFTGRAVARIFQGIPSPCFPVEEWGRNRAFWRKHMDCDFHYLCKIAGQEILRYKF